MAWKLKKVISGFQTGADIAGVEQAKVYGFETGGTMPFGYKTLDGCKPEYKELYGAKCHKSSSYVPRTRQNVRDADGTIRLAYNFSSKGEVCTLKAIKDHKKPYIDVDLESPRPLSEVLAWLEENGIETLNVAGNAEQTAAGTYKMASSYLKALFSAVKLHEG